MAVRTRNRTAVSLSKPIRDRITAGARQSDLTIEQFLSGILDEHEQRVFWESVDAVAGTYDSPVADDYSREDAMISDVEG